MIYRVYVEANPGTEIAMVGFLVRLGRIDAALETLGKVWEQATPAQIAQSAIEFARVGALPAAQAGRAEAVLKAAMEKHKRAVPLLLVLADLYNSQARYDEAEKLYREMLANDAENAVVMNNLAVLLAMRHQRLDEALRLINRAIELTGPLAQMLDSRASVHIARGEPEKAVKDLEEAIGESPDPVRLFHMAQAQLALGNRTAAVKALRDANRYGLSDDKLQSPERPINEKMQKDLLAPEPAAEPAAAPTTSWRPRGHFALSA
jgi:tetratricopeptide (TPR) repeat protein